MTLARTSVSRRTSKSSVPSLISVPPYLEKMISSPSATSICTSSPLSLRAPGPTASTRPRCGFSLAVSGRTMPLAVVSSSSRASTIRRSPSGCRFIQPLLRCSDFVTGSGTLVAGVPGQFIASGEDRARTFAWHACFCYKRGSEAGVLRGWCPRATPARRLGLRRNPSGGQAGGSLGLAEGADRPRRVRRGDRGARGHGGDRRRGNVGRQARRHPLRLHVERGAHLQGRELLPRPLLARPSRRAAARGRADTAGVQGRAGDGREGARGGEGTMIPRASWQETTTPCTR